MAESSTPADSARHLWLARAHEQDRARFTSVQREIASVVSLRNEVDELERAAEPARALFGEKRFAGLRSLDGDGIHRRFQSLASALDAAKESGQPAMVRLLWDSVKSRRFERLAEAAGELPPLAELLGISPPDSQPGAHNLELWKDFQGELADRLDWAARVRAYGHGLDRLRSARPLEHLAFELTRIAEESAHNSLELWQCWLRLWPAAGIRSNASS